MDDLTYFYDPARRHNRLRGVRDAVTGAQTGDLSSQMATETAADNYAYDGSGNLISDTQGDLSAIAWNLSGKLRSVTRADGQMVTYRYDAAGQRVAQTEGGQTTFYLRDASGNVMAIYEEKLLTEHHLYGSSRLGTRRQGEAPRTLTLGHKSYELSNHLGNVMAVVSDHKLPDGPSWRAQLQSRTDYYAFGAAMPGRSGGSGYRYGFGGQEKANEFGRDIYAYEARMYSALLGRWMSVDPLVVKYPGFSPYNYCANDPITCIDPRGMDIYRFDKKTGTFNLYKSTDDKFDQVGKFKKDKSGEYALQTNKKTGKVKLQMSNVKKGILRDGINFKERHQLIAVGGDNEPSEADVEEFALALSEISGVEIGGAYYTNTDHSTKSAEELANAKTSHMTIGKYMLNRFGKNKSTYGQAAWSEEFMNTGLIIENYLKAYFHTHPSMNVYEGDRTNASRDDYDDKDHLLTQTPKIKFYIITAPTHQNTDKKFIRIPY